MFPNDDSLPWDDTPTNKPEESTANRSRELLKALEEWRELGVSVTLAREVAEGSNNPKTPIFNWKNEIEHRIASKELAKQVYLAFERDPNRQVGVFGICGKTSGNLFVIDIDTKHWPEIGIKFLDAIRVFHPNLYKKLRIHRSPSGGYHIIYRLEELLEEETAKTRKLATQRDAKEAGIETRGHGAGIMLPPSKGYSVHQDNPIPTLTLQEHRDIIEIAVLLDEKVKIPVIKVPKDYETNYDVSPYKHYNSSPEAESLLLKHGWIEHRDNNTFTQYTRPGKDTGVSASWIKDKRKYRIFTSSTEFDGNTTYDPADVKCILEFAGNKSLLFKDLRDNGWGTPNRAYEQRIVQRVIQKGDGNLPKNFSEKATQELIEGIAQRESTYPYGVFWSVNDKDGYNIEREQLTRVMHGLGLRLHLGSPVLIKGQLVYRIKERAKNTGERDVFELLYNYISKKTEKDYDSIASTFDKFWQSSGDHILSRLTKLNLDLIVTSSRNTCYKFLPNSVLQISDKGIQEVGYNFLGERLVWADRVLERDYKYVSEEEQDKSLFVKFLRRALGDTEMQKKRAAWVVGFLAKDYKTPSEAKAIAMQESGKKEDGGGRGKGLFMRLLCYITRGAEVSGQVLLGPPTEILQSVEPGMAFIHISDIPQRADINVLKGLVTDDWITKLLWQNQIIVPFRETPSVVISTNFGINTWGDGAMKGRLFTLTFLPGFSRQCGVADVYGGNFPEIWTEDDWNGYFSYCVDSIRFYLNNIKFDGGESEDTKERNWDSEWGNGESYFREELLVQLEEWSKIEYVTNTQITDFLERMVIEGGLRTYGTGSSGRGSGVSRGYKAMEALGKETGLFEVKTGRRERINDIRQRVVEVKWLGKKDVGELGDEEGWDRIQDPDEDEVLPF